MKFTFKELKKEFEAVATPVETVLASVRPTVKSGRVTDVVDRAKSPLRELITALAVDIFTVPVLKVRTILDVFNESILVIPVESEPVDKYESDKLLPVTFEVTT